MKNNFKSERGPQIPYQLYIRATADTAVQTALSWHRDGNYHISLTALLSH